MDRSPLILSGSFAEVGRQNSVLSPGLIGLMRRLGLGAAVTAGMGAATLAYAFGEAHWPVLRRYRIEVPARPGFAGIRILHVSDLHMFPGQRFIVDFLRDVAAREQFDLVVSTGDNLSDKDSIDLLLEAYEPLLGHPGAFVLGSNDYYSPAAKSWLGYLGKDTPRGNHKNARRTSPDLPWLTLVNGLTAAGWADMSNRTDTLSVEGTTVSLIGVDDPHIRRDRVPATNDAWSEEGALRLALTHAPYRRVLGSFADAGADLILAGHTHGGQVRIPGFGAVVTNCDLPRRYGRGMHRWYPRLQDRPGEFSYLHVSAGLGTSRYAPIRFACRPEASLIEVVPSA